MTALVKPLFSVPFQKDYNFIDRKDMFSQIEEQLQRQHRVSLCGLGGVGYTCSQTLIDADTSVRKSQIAIEYAYRFQQTRPQSHVLWVYAASYTTFLQACHDIARSLKLPSCDEPRTDPCELVVDYRVRVLVDEYISSCIAFGGSTLLDPICGLGARRGLAFGLSGFGGPAGDSRGSRGGPGASVHRHGDDEGDLFVAMESYW